MRVMFPLPPLLVAGAALGGLFAPFAVSSVPTDSAARRRRHALSNRAEGLLEMPTTNSV